VTGSIIPLSCTRILADLNTLRIKLGVTVTDRAHICCRSESKARDKALAKIGREENLSNLRLELGNKRVVTIGQLRGTSRIVILAGPGAYIEEALRQSEPYKKDLLERGVLVAAYATDGATIGKDSPAAPLPSATPPSAGIISGHLFFVSKSILIPRYYLFVFLFRIWFRNCLYRSSSQSHINTLLINLFFK